MGKISVIYNGNENGTSGKLMLELASFLSGKFEVSVIKNEYKKGIFKLLSIIKCTFEQLNEVNSSQIIICHSYALLSVFSIVLSKFKGVKIIVLAWDVYPSTINKVNVNRSFSRLLIDFMEKKIYKVVDVVIVPTKEFVPHFTSKKIEIMSLWNVHQVLSKKNKKYDDQSEINVVFAGHIDKTRGLDEFFKFISKHFPGRFIIHHAGHGRIEGLNESGFTYLSYGYLGAEALSNLMSRMDAGLISLHPAFDQPAFPSKTFDYISSGLPVLYFGPLLNGYLELLEGLYVNIYEAKNDAIAGDLNECVKNFDLNRDCFLEKTALDWGQLDLIL